MKVLTIANQLTLVRLLLVPTLVILVIYGFNGWAFIAFIVAGITDGLDGLVARRTDQRTKLGAWLDPMADKLLLVSTFVVLTATPSLSNPIPVWLTVLVISRDIIIVLTVAVVNLAIERRVFYPSKLGKAATLIYILTCAFTLFFNFLGITSFIVTASVWIALLVTLLSGLDYIFRVTKTLDSSR